MTSAPRSEPPAGAHLSQMLSQPSRRRNFQKSSSLTFVRQQRFHFGSQACQRTGRKRQMWALMGEPVARMLPSLAHPACATSKV